MVLKCLRTDNGLEYLSKEFDDYCKSKGIKRHRTVPMNPQQNGVAERANRTILERVRCMLLAAGMGKRFWAEAASTAVKLMNKCPSSSIGGDTPDYRWFGGYGSYADLRNFGCKAFAHIKQEKLEARALRCVMLGYQSGVKGYRLWCIEKNEGKIIISRDVIFWEGEFPLKKKAEGLSKESGTSEMRWSLRALNHKMKNLKIRGLLMKKGIHQLLSHQLLMTSGTTSLQEIGLEELSSLLQNILMQSSYSLL